MSSSVAAFEVPDMRPKTDFEELRIMNASAGLGEPVYDDGDKDDEFAELRAEIGQ